jgi:hypothetical protein
LPDNIIINIQENTTDWKSTIVYQLPPPPPLTPIENWNPNLAGKVETIFKTFLISLGELKNTDFLSTFATVEPTDEQFSILTNKQDILSHLMDVAKQFQQFAFMQR